VSDAQGSPLAEAMNRLWEKYLPQMTQRVGTLQRAAEKLAAGVLSPAERELATGDAHKLAGVLGTFGLNDGTELAREAEGLFGSSDGENPLTTSRLRAIAEELRSTIASRN
jgi:HPt (histidine-containing phosphotransfer) domain-containing protein